MKKKKKKKKKNGKKKKKEKEKERKKKRYVDHVDYNIRSLVKGVYARGQHGCGWFQRLTIRRTKIK